MNAPAIRQDLLAAAVSRLPDNGLRARRELALARFAEQGLPGTEDEDWRYTSLRPAVELSNEWLASQAGAAAPGEQRPAVIPLQPVQRAIDAQWLSFRNGIRMDDALPRQGTFSIGSLTAGSRALIADDGLSSLNAALLERDSMRVLEKGFAAPELASSLRARRRAAFARNYMVLAGTYFQARQYRDFARCAARSLALDIKQGAYLVAFPVRLVSRLLPHHSVEGA